MQHHTTRTLPCLVASLFATAALADDPVQEESFLQDLPVVLSASRLSQPLSDTPGAVTVIDREMIRASGARNVSELFLLVPGFQVGIQSGNRPQPMVSYHGLSDDAPRRMLVQVDGRSAYSPYLIAGVEWDQLGVDLDDIERIEVFRGSNAAAYGSNAFMGIANIITRPAADTHGVAFRQRSGEDGIADTRLRLGRQLGPVDMRMTFSRSGDNGVPDQNNAHRNDMANLRADWQISPDQQLEFQAGWLDNRLDKGKVGDVVEPLRNTALTQSFGLLRWRRAASPGEEQSLTYYHQEENSRDLVSFITPPQLFGIQGQIDYGFKSTRDDIEFQQTTTAGSDLRLIWGAGARSDQIHAPQYFNTDDIIRTSILRLFGNAEWRASPRWLFNAGAMVDRHSLTGTALAPRASANYHMTEAHTIRLVASRSHRAPVAFEQKADMIVTNSVAVPTPLGTFPAGTPLVQIYRPASDLGAERVDTLEIGYLGELRDINTTLEARAYRERLHDLIEQSIEPQGVGAILQQYKMAPSPKYFANTGQADVHGV
ncbi:MAG: TonB-dependent receptor, partial [Zoogloea sp.]|nr:TonB-dependent receptor [Zoogloea sp.]